MQLELEIVDFETAKLAKQKGFPQSKSYRPLGDVDYYNHVGKLNGDTFDVIIERVRAKKEGKEPNREYETINAPALALVCKWLREDVKLDWPFEIIIRPFLSNQPMQYESIVWNRGDEYQVGKFNTYEQAQLAGIKQALNLI